jgi:hypothetical protein
LSISIPTPWSVFVGWIPFYLLAFYAPAIWSYAVAIMVSYYATDLILPIFFRRVGKNRAEVFRAKVIHGGNAFLAFVIGILLASFAGDEISKFFTQLSAPLGLPQFLAFLEAVLADVLIAVYYNKRWRQI